MIEVEIRMLILQVHSMVKMDNRLHYVSLTSNIKRAHEGKQGMRLCNKRLYKNGFGS